MRASATVDQAGKRLYIFGAVLFLWVLAIGYRLVDLQVFRYGEFLQRFHREHDRAIPVEPRRGNIYDRDGQPLAMSIDVDSAFAVPSEISDQEATANLLGQVLGIDAQQLLVRLKSNRHFAWIARKLDAETANRVRALNLRGVYFRKEPKRFYPKRELASQTIGYVGLDGEGLGGLEREFDDDLRGIPGEELYSVDARRHLYDRVDKQPDPGQNLVLTLDENIQYIAEKELAQGIEDTKAIAGTVVVQNPHTGEILALANYPTFNPNVFNDVPKEAMKNRAVSDIYEPGSVFKIVTYSAAIDQHVVTPDDLVDCQNGSIEVFGMRIHDHERLGTVTIAQALAHSSDVAAIKTGMKLGPDRFYHYIHDYGFGMQTGIELPGETRGMAKPVNRWSKVSIGAISMGQEIGVTPLQIISMISTIANNGIYTPPRIVAGELPPDGKPKPIMFHPAPQRRIIAPETAVEMKKMMEGVVLFGTARRAMLDGYTTAGKTGTAQKVDPATGTYSKTKYIASFVGFAPVNNPAVTIAVILDSAQGLHQGGQVSAPIWNRIAQQVLEYMHTPHDTDLKHDPRRQVQVASRAADEDEAPSDRLGPPLLASDDDNDGRAASRKGAPVPVSILAPSAPKQQLVTVSLKPQAEANPANTPAGPPVRVQPEAAQPGPVAAANSPGPAHGTAVIDLDSGTVAPSFLGKTLRSAVEIAQQSGVQMTALGSGVARDQSPPPGTHLLSGQAVTVRFTH